MLSSTDILPPSVVHSLRRSIINDWPDRMKALPDDIVKTNPKILGNEFEDFVFERLPANMYRTWAGRGKFLHGKSCLNHEYDIIIYRWEIKDRPILVECKASKEGAIGLNSVMAFDSKTGDIYHTYRLRYERSLNVEFKDIYRVLVTNAPVDWNALIFALAYGILVIDPNFWNIPVTIHELESLPDELRDSKVINLLGRLLNLFRMTFRGYEESLKQVYNGAELVKTLKWECTTAQAIIRRLRT